MKEFLGLHFYDVRNQHKEIWPVSKSGRETSTEIPDNFCVESVSLESQYEIPSVSGQGFSGERLNYDQKFLWEVLLRRRGEERPAHLTVSSLRFSIDREVHGVWRKMVQC